MSLTIINGGNVERAESLCKTCRFAHIQRGFRESEETVFCDYSDAVLRKVPFKVRECTDYIDRTVPTRWEMEKLALIINVEPARDLIGFDRENGDADDASELTVAD